MENGDFENGWWHKTHNGVEYDNIFVPQGWTAFWNEAAPYGRPEMKCITAVPPYLDPPRIHSGNGAVQWFTMWRTHDAGLYQQISVISGMRLRFTAWAHAWSSQQDDPHYSTLVTEDDLANFTFTVGIDPTGGIDPWGATVVWGAGVHIYDTYAQIPTIETVATNGVITVFIRSVVKWAFKHCDAYVDTATLEVVEEPPEPPVCPQARESYERTYALIPPGHNSEWATVLAPVVDNRKTTVGFSADDAFIYVTGMGKRTVLALNPTAWNGDLLAFWQEWYPSTADSLVEYVPITATTPQEWLEGIETYYDTPPAPPQPSGPYIAYGTKLGIHASAPAGTPEHAAALAQAGAPIPVFKVVQDFGYLKTIKQASPHTITVARWVMPFDGAGEVQNWTQAQIRSNAVAFMAAYYQVLQEQAQYDDGQRLSYIDYFELLNEPDPPGAQGYANLARLGIAMLDIGETWDLPVKKFALFGLNVGTPEWDEMQAVADTGLLERIAAGGHVLTLHEGVLPFSDPIDSGFPGTIPGAPTLDPSGGALCGRYRYWLYLARQRGLYLPIVISEFYSGPNYDPSSASQIIERIAWYDGLIKDDPEVLGICPFTIGQGPPQDYGPFLPDFYAYAISVKDRQNAAPSRTTPPEPPIPPAIAYSQRDSRWASKRLLPSYATMGGSGCLVTSIAIKATEYDQAVTPGNLCDCLCANGGFNSNGGLLFYQVDDCLPWLQFRGYTLWADTANMAMVEAALARGSTIIKVDFYPSTEPIDSHFVYVGGWVNTEHTDLTIIDPWTGEHTTLMTKYPRATLAASIKGLVDYEIVPTASTTLIGFNDCDGPNGSASQWMMEH